MPTHADPLAKGLKKIVMKQGALERLKIEYVPIDSIKPNPYNPNRQAEKEFEMLLSSMQEDGFCVEVSTPILCADLIWRPASELQVGQEIVAFDEESDPTANYKHGRRFRTATVTANSVFEDDLYEVQTEHGDKLRCNAQHPWLTRRRHGPMGSRLDGDWVETRDLQPNDEVVKLLEPWGTDRSYEAGWLAGFLDGEGCVSAETTHNGSAVPVVRLSASQAPGATADKMIVEIQKRCARAKATTVLHSESILPKRVNWQDSVRIRVNNMAEVMSLLGSVRPARLLENAGQFWVGRSIATRNSGRTISSVSKVGRGKLAALSTSTKTYIAAGFAVHNTQPIVVQRASREIVDGEHRWRAARKLGLAAVPVVLVDMTPEQMRISTMRHNRARGSEEVELAAQVLRDLQELGAIQWAQASLQMSDEEINKLVADVTVAEGMASEAFGEAWSPVRNAKEGQGVAETEMSTGFQEMNAKLQDRLDKANTAEERASIEKERRDQSYRVSVTFSADDAELVKRVLNQGGLRPVAKLLALCQAYEQVEGHE